MSLLEKYLKGWSFRTSRPSFEPDEELTVIVSEYDDGSPVARIGDTVLHVDDVPPNAIDRRVRVRVTEFDENEHDGRATYLETVGETAF